MSLSRDSSPAPGPSHNHLLDILPSGDVTPEAPVSIQVAKLLGFPINESRFGSRSHSRLRDVIWDENPSDTESNHSAASDRPWYRRPSPWWILPVISMGALMGAMTIAPRTEVYIRLVCAELKPEYVLHPALPINSTTPLPIDITSSPHGVYVNPPREVYPASAAAALFKVPRPTTRCASDPVIGARVASLATAITFVMGFISFITTSWWAKVNSLWVITLPAEHSLPAAALR